MSQHQISFEPAAAARLGKNTSTVDQNARSETRLGQWAAKNKAAKLVYAVDHKAGERISKCGYCAFGSEVTLTATKRPDGSTSGAISGVISCGNVWACPVCSARISAERRDEMNILLAWARSSGYAIVMATLTFRHNAGMPLQSSLDAFKRANKRLRQSKSWRKVEFVGTVTATETTHGRNGWHVHQHVLMILPGSETDALAAVEGLADPWRAALEKEGLNGNVRAFDVQPATAAGDYVCKFGAAEEVALGHNKKGRGGRTPWQLLADARDGDAKAGRLFQEYALAFKGRRQLVWSKGLKAACGVDKPADAESDGDETAAPVVVRTWRGCSEFWRRARRRRCALIAAVENGDCLDKAEFGLTDAERWRRHAQNALVIDPAPL